MKRLALAALLLAGCARTESYDLVVEPVGFTPDQIDDVFAAADEWRTVVPVRFNESVGFCPDPLWNTICVRARDSNGPDHLGLTYPHDELDYSAHVEMYVGTLAGSPAGTFRRVAAHELGHAQGLDHDTPGTLMFKDCCVQQAPAPTPRDVDQWWHLRWIEPSRPGPA